MVIFHRIHGTLCDIIYVHIHARCTSEIFIIDIICHEKLGYRCTCTCTGTAASLPGG